MGFHYDLPNTEHPLFVAKLGIEHDGEIVAAALLRLTSESYLLMNKEVGTPAERWDWLLSLHEAVRESAFAQGLDDVHCWLPPEIERQFGRRLFKLKWQKQLWPCFSRRVED